MRHIAANAVLVFLLALVLPAPSLDGPMRELLAAGRIDELIRTANARLATSPRDSDAYLLAGRAYFAAEKWDKAAENFERATAFTPDNSDYHMWLGRAYGEKADHASIFTAMSWAKRARKEFERAIQLNPANVGAHSDLAEFYIDAPGLVGGGLDKARREVEVLAKLDPALAHSLQARIADKQKDYQEAERESQAAIAAAGNDQARYWLNLASLYEKWKRRDDMDKAIAKSLVAPRARTDVIFYAAELLYRNGRSLTSVEELLRKYLANPDEEAPAFQAHYLLGAVLEKQGKKPEAAQEYQAALALASDFDKARSALRRVQ